MSLRDKIAFVYLVYSIFVCLDTTHWDTVWSKLMDAIIVKSRERITDKINKGKSGIYIGSVGPLHLCTLPSWRQCIFESTHSDNKLILFSNTDLDAFEAISSTNALQQLEVKLKFFCQRKVFWMEAFAGSRSKTSFLWLIKLTSTRKTKAWWEN